MNKIQCQPFVDSQTVTWLCYTICDFFHTPTSLLEIVFLAVYYVVCSARNHTTWHSREIREYYASREREIREMSREREREKERERETERDTQRETEKEREREDSPVDYVQSN